MSDPWKSLGVSKTKDLAISFIHTSTAVADKEFKQSIKDILIQSPYFNNMIHGMNHIRLQTEGTRNSNMLGTDLIGAVLSEVNFWKPEWIAQEKMNTAMGRYTSRFGKYEHFIGFIIFDTSARGDASVMEKFLKENALGDKILSVSASQWAVKGNERGGFFQNGGFWVYAGDSLKSPFILEADKGQTVESLSDDVSYDKSRFIYCPNELYPEFKADIIKALNDKAGYSTHSTGKFFENPTVITDCVRLPKLNEDSIMVDFYDTDDKLSDHLYQAISRIDPNTPCYIHLDMGYVHDLCGFSLIQFNKWEMYGEKGTKYPSFRVPIAVGISRKSGQETSALHVYDLIIELSKRFDIASVSYDTHQTRPIVQELMRAGIDTKLISVDRTTEPYIVLKSLMSRKLIELPNNQILLRELAELKYVGPDKIDHPSSGAGSKDISDSLCGAIFNAYTNIDMASEPSANTFKAKQQAKLFDMAESRDFNNPFQSMINGLFQ